MSKQLERVATRHGFGVDAVRAMYDALRAGNGTMAQFDHAEFGGLGQWMRGGMVLTSDGAPALRERIDRLCVELAELLASDDDASAAEMDDALPQGRRWKGARRDQSWWPTGLGLPSTVGGQDEVAYAYFPSRDRLAIRTESGVTIYDTTGHRIVGFGQRSDRGDLEVTTAAGTVGLESLRVVSRMG